MPAEAASVPWPHPTGAGRSAPWPRSRAPARGGAAGETRTSRTDCRRCKGWACGPRDRRRRRGVPPPHRSDRAGRRHRGGCRGAGIPPARLPHRATTRRSIPGRPAAPSSRRARHSPLPATAARTRSYRRTRHRRHHAGRPERHSHLPVIFESHGAHHNTARRNANHPSLWATSYPDDGPQQLSWLPLPVFPCFFASRKARANSSHARRSHRAKLKACRGTARRHAKPSRG